MDTSNRSKAALMRMLLIVVMILHILLGVVTGHGRLWEPPSRSSMWRRGYNTTVNINDNELSCGGFTNQWISYDGLCGVCGDPYQQEPRDNEIGGKYDSGIITRTYPISGTIDVVIGLTANHEGYFEFKMCPIHDPAIAATHACMDNHRLPIMYGEDNGYKYYIRDPNLEGDVKLTLILPRKFVCQHCVLQWRYRTATRWGCDPDLSCGKGKGPQEEFYGCSDISIADVATTIYNYPVLISDPELGTKGLNDLGSDRTSDPRVGNKHTRASSYHKHHTEKHTIVLDSQTTAKPLTSILNEHIATNFLEEITLNALFSYYGTNNNHKPGHCTPTTRYVKNPIVHEFCRRFCSYDISVCPDLLCSCTPDPVASNDNVILKTTKTHKHVTKGHNLDRDHLQKFVRRLIVKNKLIENIPTLKLKAPSIIKPSHISDARMPRLGRMEVVVPPPTTVAIISSLEVTKNILNEANMTSSKSSGDTLAIMAGSNSNGYVTKRSPERSSLIDPDKFVQTQPTVKPKTMICAASPDFSHNPFMANWCNTNCPFGFCPSRVCSCS